MDPLLLLVARMQVLVSEVGEEEEGEEEVAIQLLEEVPRLAPNIQYSCDYIKLLVDYRTRVGCVSVCVCVCQCVCCVNW